jgi:hypothetical protein
MTTKQLQLLTENGVKISSESSSHNLTDRTTGEKYIVKYFNISFNNKKRSEAIVSSSKSKILSLNLDVCDKIYNEMYNIIAQINQQLNES